MAKGDKPKLADDRGGPLTFPPGLVSTVRGIASGYAVDLGWSDEQLSELLVTMFFASMRAEEHEHYPLRVALVGGFPGPEKETAIEDRWRAVRFRTAVPFSARQLVRLARAASSERLHAIVAAPKRLLIVGLGYELPEARPGTLKLVAPEPGSLEVWIGRERVLDYAQGRVMEPPENVLLAAGSVRARLLTLSASTGLPHYVECVAALVRHMADHAYGGILIMAPEGPATATNDAGFLLEPGLSVGAVLERLATLGSFDEATRGLVEESLRAELDRVLAEVGRLTALDGATVLDSQLNVLGFGIILPVVDDILVLEALDAAARSPVHFPMHQYGARHRAAASYAGTHPGSLVFVASADGDITCMLREPQIPHVLVWRFRSGDLSHD